MITERAWRQGSADVDRSRVEPWRLVCLISLGVFIALGLAAYAIGALPGDQFLLRVLGAKDAGFSTDLARRVNHAGRAEVLVPGTILLFWLSTLARRRWWLWCGVLVGAPLLQNVLKLLVGRSRPDGSALGFPSGHVTAATAFAVVVIYVLHRERLGRGQRLALTALAVCLALAVGWARMIRYAHWPSDVLGGVLLGTCCAAAAAWWECSRSA